MQNTDLPNQIKNMSQKVGTKFSRLFRIDHEQSNLSYTEWLEIFPTREWWVNGRSKETKHYLHTYSLLMIFRWYVLYVLCIIYTPTFILASSHLYSCARCPKWLTRRTASSWSPFSPQYHHLILHLDGHLIATSTYSVTSRETYDRVDVPACLNK